MADRITLEVATPSRLVIAEQVDEVVVPGIEGYFGVLPGHAALLSTLGIGEPDLSIGATSATPRWPAASARSATTR